MAGSIQIDVLANTQKLVSGMKRAESTVGNAAKSMTRAVQAFAAVFVGGKLIGAINRSSDAIDKLGKTASKLGIGTQELGALQFAAEQSGIKVETLNMALQRSTRRISEAANGTGSAVKALEELGLSAEQLNQLSPDEQLNAIADAMETVSSESDKVRLSFSLFDSAGVDLVNMLKGGSASLKAYAAEAASLGILIDESMVKGVEAANDASNRLSKSFGLVATTINVQLAPYIKYAADSMVILSQQITDSGTAMGSFNSIVKVVAKGVIGSFQAMQLAVSGYTSVFLYLKTAVLNVSGDVIGATQAWTDFNASVAEGDAIFIKLAGTIDGNGAALNNFLDSIEKIKLGFKEAGLGGAAAMTTINKSLVETDKLTKKAEGTISGGLTGAFRSSLDGANTWGDALSGIIKDLIAQLFQMYVVQQLVGGISFGASAGTSASGLTTTADYSHLQSLPSFSGGGFTGAGGRSGGVDGIGGFPAILHPNETVIDHTKSSGTTVNVYNNTNSSVSVQEDEAGKIDIIISTIANQISRGTGVLGTSFEERYGLSKA